MTDPAPLPGPRPNAVPLHGVQPVAARQSLQGHLARLTEGDATRALRELLEERRHEHLAAARLCRDPRGEDHVAPEEVVALADRLAGVHPDSYTDRLFGVVVGPGPERALDGNRAVERAACAREGDHEAVPLRLHLKPVVTADLGADHGVVLAKDL